MKENDFLITKSNPSFEELIINKDNLIQKQPNERNNNPKLFFSYTEKEIKNKYCEICEKTFSTTGNLRNHMMTIHQNLRPFQCPFPGCKKKYSIQSRLQVHCRIHTGKKPFICPSCSKAFNEKGNLKTHERFHSKKRPFKCDQCSKTYKTNGHLKDHIEIQHLNIKRFQCKYCLKKFGRISTLKSHIKTHTGEKNYKCHIEGCNKFFAEKGNMEIHYKRHLKRLNYGNISTNNLNLNLNSSITRPSSNFTLFNLPNNNILSSFNNQMSIQNNNNNEINIHKNDGYMDNVSKNNNNNFIIYENGNITFPNGNSNYPNNCMNNNDKNELNYLDSPQNINFESEKVFEVNLDN